MTHKKKWVASMGEAPGELVAVSAFSEAQKCLQGHWFSLGPQLRVNGREPGTIPKSKKLGLIMWTADGL